MPSFFVTQPNGFIARFSTVLDDFTATNMTEIDATEVITLEYAKRAKRDSAQSIAAAKSDTDGKAWEDCIARIRLIHGDAVASERLQTVEPKDKE